MIASESKGIRIAGISCAVPTRQVDSMAYAEVFGEETVEKLIASTGVRGCYHTHAKQTASDLAFVAAERLLCEKQVDRSDIGVMIFVTPYPDYTIPASAFVLHKRLRLSWDCVAYDINLGCSATVFGMQTVCALLQCSSARKALLLVGDTPSKDMSPYDTSRILFGDAGIAILFEKTTADIAPICYGMKSDGERFKSIIIPAGRYRNPEGSSDRVLCEDGNRRSPFDTHMNGMDVFSFTMTDVPALFREFMEHYQVGPEEVDALILHQPNGFILKHLAKKLKISEEKMPISLDRYGNTGGASIPVTLCDAYGGKPAQTLRVMLSAFGVGLSWGVVTTTLDTSGILPIIHTDEYYQDGGIDA